MKFNNIKIFLITALSLLLLISCDIIDKPYLDNTGNVDTTKYEKKVLLEDYTGFKCGSCPKAHIMASQLVEDFADNIIIMAIHCGTQFAKPDTKHPYDFRTTEGTEWDVQFGMSNAGLPKGMVNRKSYDGSSKVTSFASWSQYVADALTETPVVTLKLSADYDPSSRKISVSVSYNYLEEFSEFHNLNVCITEDSIVNYQLWYGHTPEDVEDYVHNHVLRYTFMGSWGEKLTASKGMKSYSYTIPAESDWRPEKLNIIAFISDVEKTYEVLQVEKTELIK